MTVMTAPRTELPTDRPLTVEDLDLLPDDGFKYELDDGVLVVTPPPEFNHQYVLHNLQLGLGAECPAEIADLSGDEAFDAVRPFAVRIVPSALVAGPWNS